MRSFWRCVAGIFALVLLACGSVGIAAIFVPSAAVASPAVVVTNAELCAETKDAVMGSVRYAMASRSQRAAINTGLRFSCLLLAKITPTTPPRQRATILALHKVAVNGLARGGWLSSSDADILKLLAQQIDDQPPVAVIAGPATAVAGVPIAFSGSDSDDPDGMIAAYLWSWGDGDPTSTGENVTHTFAAAGSYTVTLVVIDDRGAASLAAALSVEVSPPNRKPLAVISDPGAAVEGAEVEFSGAESTDPDGSIVAYAWTWGDGSDDGTDVEPTHTYAAAGTYTVTLVVTDDDGASSDVATFELVVEEAPAPGPCASGELLSTADAVLASFTLTPQPAAPAVCTLLQVVPEPNLDFPKTAAADQIGATGLFGPGRSAIPNPPAGTTRLTVAVQFAGYKGSSLKTCFAVPVAASGFETLRIAYYDTTPNIDRWVFLRTAAPADGRICMSRGLRSPIPAVFALFGNN